MTLQGRPRPGSIAKLTTTGRAASGPRATSHDGSALEKLFGDKPFWPLAECRKAVVEFTRRGVAVVSSNAYEPRDGALKLLRPVQTRNLGLAFPGLQSTSREVGESWSKYVTRSAAETQRWLREMPGVAGHKDLLVDFAWVTQDELTQFALPGYVRLRIANLGRTGEGPWPYWEVARVHDGSRVRHAGPEQDGSFYGSWAKSLDAVPREAVYLGLDGRAKDVAELARFRKLELLRVRYVSEATLEAIRRVPTLRFLWLDTVRAQHLRPLAALSRLEGLACEDSGSLRTLSGLEPLRKLRVLTMVNLRRFTSLESLRGLVQLRGLSVGGALWTTGTIESLEPLSGLRNLRRLYLGNIKVADRSLRPLAALSRLTHLELPNRFGLREFAELATAHPQVDAELESPFLPLTRIQVQLFGCKVCGRHVRRFTRGSPSRHLCPECDASAVARHMAKWERERARAAHVSS
jgi:hypothetical protein